MGYHELFSWGWPPTTVLLISASQVARIMDVSHWLMARNFFFCCVGDYTQGLTHTRRMLYHTPQPMLTIGSFFGII
jgi:hypothetical protein